MSTMDVSKFRKGDVVKVSSECNDKQFAGSIGKFIRYEGDLSYVQFKANHTGVLENNCSLKKIRSEDITLVVNIEVGDRVKFGSDIGDVQEISDDGKVAYVLFQKDSEWYSIDENGFQEPKDISVENLLKISNTDDANLCGSKTTTTSIKNECILDGDNGKFSNSETFLSREIQHESEFGITGQKIVVDNRIAFILAVVKGIRAIRFLDDGTVSLIGEAGESAKKSTTHEHDVGDRVEFTKGKYKGKFGTVVSTTDKNIGVLFDDGTKPEPKKDKSNFKSYIPASSARKCRGNF